MQMQQSKFETPRMTGTVSASDRCLSAPPGPMETIAATAMADQLARQEQVHTFWHC